MAWKCEICGCDEQYHGRECMACGALLKTDVNGFIVIEDEIPPEFRAQYEENRRRHEQAVRRQEIDALVRSLPPTYHTPMWRSRHASGIVVAPSELPLQNLQMSDTLRSVLENYMRTVETPDDT